MINLNNQAELIGDLLRQQAYLLVTAESCTGGGVAQALTSVSGSSQWFDRGFVTYSNGAKQDMLGVPPELITTYGAVSEAVVRSMAEGALRHSQAQLSVAVSGIAGPTGGAVNKPVGTVWFAWAMTDHKTVAECQQFEGDRAQVRLYAVSRAMQGLVDLMLTGEADGRD